MQYFRITGVDNYGGAVNYKSTIRLLYSNSLHAAMCQALYCPNLGWDDFAEGVTSKTFNDLILNGEKSIELTGWAGKFTVELFNDEQDEYFSLLFKEHPQPWKWANDISRCGNGEAIHGVVDANGECIVSTYAGYLATEVVWNLYKFYVNKTN